MGHFRLQIDPDLVRESKRSYGKIAEELREQARKARKTPAEVGDDWIGEAAITVKANMTSLATVLGKFADDFEDAETALKTLAHAYDQGLVDLKEINRKYAAAETSYENTKKSLQKMEHRNRFEEEEAGRAKAQTQGGLSTDYDNLVERMRTATKTAATTLSTSTYVTVDPGAAKQLASPQGFATALAAINDSVEESLGDDLSLVQRADSQDDAEKSQAVNDAVTNLHKFGTLDKDARAKVVAALAKRMTDPEFAGMLAAKLSPQDLADLLNSLDREAEASYKGQDITVDMSTEELDTQRYQLMRVLGTTYGLATQVTGDYQLPDDVVDDWVKAMTTPPDWHTNTYPVGLPPGTPDAGQNVLLASLMTQGQWDPKFLADTTTKLIDFERGNVPDGRWSNWQGSSRLVGTPGGGPMTDDPVAQMLEALGNNRAAAQMVFGEGPTRELEVNGQKYTVNDTMAYLMLEHRFLASWDPDNPGDQGKLGRALALAMSEVPGESSPDGIREDLDDIVTWGEAEAARLKKEQEENDYPWYVDLGHFVLDLGGLIPVVGEGFDLANAAWYGAEGRWDMAAFSAASAIPGLGYAAVVGKWGKSSAKALKALEAAAKIDRYAAALPAGVKVTKALDGTFQPMLKLEIESADDLAAVLKTPLPNTQFVFRGQKFSTDATGAIVITGGGSMRKFMLVSRYPDPGSRLVYQRYPGAPKHEFVVDSNGALVLQKNLKDLDNLERGQAFNAANWKRFDHNEIYVVGPKGKGFVDSYVPNRFIIERKATFYGDLKDPMAKLKSDIKELTSQYRNATVTATKGNQTNHSALVSQKLKGQSVLEIPPQQLTPAMIRYAESKGVTIVDPSGKVYTPNSPLKGKYP